MISTYIVKKGSQQTTKVTTITAIVLAAFCSRELAFCRLSFDLFLALPLKHLPNIDDYFQHYTNSDSLKDLFSFKYQTIVGL